jgi:hypothetical protein
MLHNCKLTNVDLAVFQKPLHSGAITTSSRGKQRQGALSARVTVAAIMNRQCCLPGG